MTAIKYAVVRGRWTQYTALARRLRDHGQWIFRGQPNDKWELQTALERSRNRWGYTEWTGSAEFQAVQLAAASSYLFSEAPPALPSTEVVDWLSVLQHYGCPTRLLDFSWSFYVAAWFAVSQADDDSAIWCVNADNLSRRARRVQRSDTDVLTRVNQVLLDTEKSQALLAGPVTPKVVTERLSRQQGTFLLPLSSSESFMTCLSNTFGTAEPQECRTKELAVATFDDLCVIKLIMSADQRVRILDDLHHMNIHAASLFEGFTGFARSLERFVSSEPIQRRRLVGQLRRVLKRL